MNEPQNIHSLCVELILQLGEPAMSEPPGLRQVGDSDTAAPIVAATAAQSAGPSEIRSLAAHQIICCGER